MRQHKLEIVEQKQIEAILVKGRVGRLGTLGDDGYPYIVPVNYVYWQGAVYFHCALVGEKLDNIRRLAKVCFEIDFPLAYFDTGFDAAMPVCGVSQFYQSIVIRGTAEIVENIEEKVGALNRLMASHENKPDFNAITADIPAVASCHVVAIRIDRLTAKANLAQKKSGEERLKIRDYLMKRGLPGDREAADLIPL